MPWLRHPGCRVLQIEADSQKTTFATYKTRFPAPGTYSQPLANGKVSSPCRAKSLRLRCAAAPSSASDVTLHDRIRVCFFPLQVTRNTELWYSIEFAGAHCC